MGKIFPGLVSITFRQLSVAGVIDLASRAGLSGIEWGGDLHVPHGNLEEASRVSALTQEAGLQVAAYGSYYRVGNSENDGLSFDHVLQTALALEAPLIRVWAGIQGSRQAESSYRQWVTEEFRRIAGLAGGYGIKVACEYHGGTLTDENNSAVQLMREVDHPNFYSLWQPLNGFGLAVCQESLEGIFPWMSNVHVFHWWPDQTKRLPLAEGKDRWLPYLKRVAEKEGDRFALLEFVAGDDPEALLRDAATLKNWLAEIV
jgi:3-dehydroshikimate dehydratase